MDGSMDGRGDIMSHSRPEHWFSAASSGFNFQDYQFRALLFWARYFNVTSVFFYLENGGNYISLRINRVK